ncbi:MAG: A/G-specific adenine glycosylase [Thermodesulfobacteriota bacterium]
MKQQAAGPLSAEARAGLQKALIEWYRINGRHLPWRKTRDPYRIWVSEIMLQQTQVKTVIAYYSRFIERFPDIFALAAADLETVLKLWEGLGYYSRARNFHAAARQLVADGGAVPEGRDLFRRLPGVGDYIAAAVLSIAFEKPYPVVDGNVKRVLSRLFEIPAAVNRQSSYKRFKAACSHIFDKEEPGQFNQALMELGALVCKPRSPDCGRCPIGKWCSARLQDKAAHYPVREQRKPVPCHRMAIGVVVKAGRLLIVKRPVDRMLGGLWEFPGGVVGPDEAAEEACVRWVRESLGLSVTVDSRLTSVRHAYTHFKIIADVFICRYAGGRVRRTEAAAHCWAHIEALSKYPFAGAQHKIFPPLKDWYATGFRDIP